MFCPFCDLDGAHVTAETKHALARLDRFPVTEGHTLIVSRRHVSNFFDLSMEEQQDIMSLLNTVKQRLDQKYGTCDYNVGINCGPLAGQTVDHVHVHLIPRREGDADDPRGGVRWVIPEKARYWND